MPPINKFRSLLKNRNYKVTTPRKAVFTELTKSPSPLTNTALISRLGEIDKVSVYRTIALFESIGIIHRVWTGFKSKIELSEQFSPHHHHFTCSTCQASISFKDENLEKALHSLEGKYQLKVTQHVIELIGFCNNCQASD